MRIVIEIPNEDIPKHQEVIDIPIHFMNGNVCEAGGYGFDVLPKGQGRLIILSEDAVKREQTSLSFSCQQWISEAGLSNATVAIIEEDKQISGCSSCPHSGSIIDGYVDCPDAYTEQSQYCGLNNKENNNGN